MEILARRTAQATDRRDKRCTGTPALRRDNLSPRLVAECVTISAVSAGP